MTDTLNGELAYLLIVAILDAALLSWIALRWYRRSVSAMMAAPPSSAAPAASSFPAASSTVVQPEPFTPGAFQMQLRHVVDGTAHDSDRPEAVASRRRIGVAYTAGALAYAAVITAATFAESPTLPLPGVAALLWANAWLIWPVLTVLFAYDLRQSLRLLAQYALAGAAGVALVTLLNQALRGTFNTAVFTNIFWATANLLVIASIPIVLLALTGIRRVRAVMPLALSSTLLFGLGLLVFRRLIAAALDHVSVRTVLLQLAAWSTTDVAYYGVYLLLSLPIGWCAWRALRGLASGYSRKRYSDLQLMVDCWFLIVTAATTATSLVGPFGLRGIAIGALAFVAYRGTVATALWAWPVAGGTTDRSSRLLLLRVFGYQARTELLFDQLARNWRFYGPVQLIAGVDLAMRTVDPGDMLSFVEGRLRELYVTSVRDIESRIARLDVDRDPDGRFRVNDVYCLHDTWKPTLQAMLSVTDRVVMDLRGFSKENSGCRYELEQLVGHLPSDSIVLICDHSTDEPLLRHILDDAIERNGKARESGPASLVRIDSSSRVEIQLIMQCLLGRYPHRRAEVQNY